MNETMKRRNLLAGLDVPPRNPQDEAIAVAATMHGFASNPAGEPQAHEAMSPTRRHRRPIGRVHQLNVRLRAETLEAIYAQANGRNIPIAQVIEDAMDALAREKGNHE